MNVAVTVWDGWISPVFDVCREVLVLEIDHGDVVSSIRVDLGRTSPLEKIERLLELGVETLICGAISEAVHAETAHRGLDVIGFVAGETDPVVEAFLRDGLPAPALSMPGCGCGGRRRIGGGGCVGGRARRREDPGRSQLPRPMGPRREFMKVAVTATGPTLESAVDPRFGRCAYFVLVDRGGSGFEAVDNASSARSGGAGIQSAQVMARRGVGVVLTGSCGPNAHQTLSAAGIDVVLGCRGTVAEAVARFEAGELRAASGPNVESHAGLRGERS